MSIFLVSMEESLARLRRKVMALFDPVPQGIPMLEGSTLSFVNYPSDSMYELEVHMRCVCTLSCENYPEQLLRLVKFRPVHQNFAFYVKAVGALLMSFVQIARFTPGSALYQLSRDITKSMPGQNRADRRQWNDVLLVCRLPMVAMYQDMWDEGHYDLLLMCTHLMCCLEVMTHVCLRLSREELLGLMQRLEQIDARVRRNFPPRELEGMSMVPDVFLRLVACSLPEPESIHDLLPFIERLHSPYLQLEVIHLCTVHYSLLDYRHIVELVNRYQRELLVWNIEYFELLLCPNGLHHVHRLEDLISEQAVLLVRAIHGMPLSAKIQRFLRKHAALLRSVHAELHTEVLANPWLLHEYISFHETDTEWSQTYWLGDKCCVVDAMRRRFELEVLRVPYDRITAYHAFRAMMVAIDRCYGPDGSGSALEFMMTRSLMDGKPMPGAFENHMHLAGNRASLVQQKRLQTLSRAYHVQYRHTRSAYALLLVGGEASMHPFIGAKRAAIFAALRPRRIPDAVIEYLLQWI